MLDLLIYLFENYISTKPKLNINDITVKSEIKSTYCDGSDGTGAITIVTSETNGEVTYAWTGPNGFSSTDQNSTGLE